MQFEPIAFVHGPYKQKFAIPRQPSLVREAVGEIRFIGKFADPNAVRGLESFSHLWLLFVFHATLDQGWRPTVTPPRLGGTERIGVFASRSMFRPNPIGLSVVKLEGIEQRGKELLLRVSGLDLLDGTPLLDIKPYLPYADSIPDALGAYAQEPPAARYEVRFSEAARTVLAEQRERYPMLEGLIISVLQQDPRPAQHVRKGEGRGFGMFLYDLNIRWTVSGDQCEVLGIDKVQGN